MAGDQTSQTGTRDETYDIVSVLYHALKGAQNCEKYSEDAEDDELREFFEMALDQQRDLADVAKLLLARRLQSGDEQGESGAFFRDEDSASGEQADEEDEVPASGSAS